MANDSSALLTDAEERLLQFLGEAWNQFAQLPELHPCDRQEFVAAIHAAQNIVMARPVMRALKEKQHEDEPL